MTFSRRNQRAHSHTHYEVARIKEVNIPLVSSMHESGKTNAGRIDGPIKNENAVKKLEEGGSGEMKAECPFRRAQAPSC